jgi:hypothetical protein
LGEKYFEKNNNSYILTKDTYPNQDKIYYRANYKISKTYNPSHTYFELNKIPYYSGEDFNSSLLDSNNNLTGTDFKIYSYSNKQNE